MEETETTFCEKTGDGCGNPHNPVPKAPQFSTASDSAASFPRLACTAEQQQQFRSYFVSAIIGIL